MKSCWISFQQNVRFPYITKKSKCLPSTLGWVFVFDSVWPRHKDKIGVVVSSIEQHCLLMTDEVTLENISGAYRARVEDMKRWQREFEFHERQDFKSVEDYISPRLYDDELDRLQRTICERTGRWIQREKTLKRWIDTSDESTKVVWLQGIPGAGTSKFAQWLSRSCWRCVTTNRQNTHFIHHRGQIERSITHDTICISELQSREHVDSFDHTLPNIPARHWHGTHWRSSQTRFTS